MDRLTAWTKGNAFQEGWKNLPFGQSLPIILVSLERGHDSKKKLKIIKKNVSTSVKAWISGNQISME